MSYRPFETGTVSALDRRNGNLSFKKMLSTQHRNRKESTMKRVIATAFIAGLSFLAVDAQAGCLSGAAVGGVGGHVAGHHALLGAAGGCAVGHHMAKKKEKQQAAAQQAPANGAH